MDRKRIVGNVVDMRRETGQADTHVDVGMTPDQGWELFFSLAEQLQTAALYGQRGMDPLINVSFDLDTHAGDR